jgi:SAM-dependent methyltransferase
MRYPVNRRCPITGGEAVRVLGHMPAGLIGASNATYRPDALAILGLDAADEFPIVEGPSGFTYAGWLPDEGFLHRLYENAIDHAKTSTEQLWYRRFLLEMAGGLLDARAQTGTDKQPLKLLDYGCGYGVLLRLLASRDVIAVGYEPSAERGERVGAIETLGDLAEVATRGPFDLMVCTEVLEHMPEPRQALQFLRANAAPGALLLVTVPHCRRPYVKAALDGFAAGQPQSLVFNPWEHLNYFSGQDLRRLLREEGFAPVIDLGRTLGAREALARQGVTSPLELAVNALRVAKRMLSAPDSTQLVCRCA